MPSTRYDAVVVGAGPNGLAAAVTIARAGRSVLVVEAAPMVGGGARTNDLGEAGFRHDVCSAVHPFGAVSPFFASVPLADHGLDWIHPEIALAHPLADGRAGVLLRSLTETATGLGAHDGRAYRRLFGPLVKRWSAIASHVLGPVVRVPRHPLAMASFGLRALPPASLIERLFDSEEGKALFAGSAAHAFLPLTAPLTASFGTMLLGAAHVGGWPIARTGSQAIADALAAELVRLGGEIECDRPVRSTAELPPSDAVLLDLTPRQVAEVASHRLPARYLGRLRRYRYGPGAFKVDYTLTEPVPWTNDACRKAGTVHVGGTAAEIAESERLSHAGRIPERPFVLVAQQSLADRSRAPGELHTLWTYCHVPHGSDVDMTAAVEAQIERFAPGFRDVIRTRHVTGPAAYERYNANLVGGDIAGGSHGGLQLLFRPLPTLRPYRTPDPTLFLCSSSTPPGAGVHGMCGFNAATVALRTALA